jgi:hypothetical protein
MSGLRIRSQQVIGSSPIAGSKISSKSCRFDVHDRSHSRLDPLAAENRFHVARTRGDPHVLAS